MSRDLTIGSVPELFLEGMGIVRAWDEMSAAFGMTAAQWESAESLKKIERFLKTIPARALVNPDQFYTSLYMGLAGGFDSSKGLTKGDVQQLIAKEYPMELFAAVHNKFTRDIQLWDVFGKRAGDFALLSDDELKSHAATQFEVSYQSLLTTAQSNNFIFTKINHGYWEQFLSIYTSTFDARSTAGEFRKLAGEVFDSSYSASGMDGALALLIKLKLSESAWRCGGDGNGVSRLAINYSAGESTFLKTLNRPLNSVSRGAIAGSLAFFASITKNEPIILGDGSEAKKLIDDRELITFAENFVNDAPAVLFVVPQHLKDIVARGMKGRAYKMIVPRRYAHETWRVTLPVFASLVRRLVAKHKKVIILTQAAVLAPILGLSLPRILEDAEDESAVKFFDLGRVLDVASPETTSWQPWFKPYVDIPLRELCPFELSNVPVAPHLLYEDRG